MYDDSDLDAGVKHGVISAEAAQALRNLSAARSGVPLAAEERFLATGLADLMTAAALLLLLVGCTVLAAMLVGPAAVGMLGIACWVAAERFAHNRRLFLTSFVLLAGFAVASAGAAFAAALLLPGPQLTADLPVTEVVTPLRGTVTAAGSLLGTAAFWLRFRFPPAYAAASLAGLNLAMHLLRLVAPDASAAAAGLTMLIGGAITLALALWWDISDIRRETERSQIGFWLHAIAGYQLAGASFTMVIGAKREPVGWERLYSFDLADPTLVTGSGVLLLFALFLLLAITIDRRSLLVSSLFFVVPALAYLTAGGSTNGWLVSASLTGALLLLLATKWNELRRAILSHLPPMLSAQLPRTDLRLSPRPVR